MKFLDQVLLIKDGKIDTDFIIENLSENNKEKETLQKLKRLVIGELICIIEELRK